MLVITHGVLTIAPGQRCQYRQMHKQAKHTSHDIEHISIVRRRSKCGSSLALAQGFQHADCRTMYITR